MYPLYHEKEQLRLHVFFCFKKIMVLQNFLKKLTTHLLVTFYAMNSLISKFAVCITTNPFYRGLDSLPALLDI